MLMIAFCDAFSIRKHYAPGLSVGISTGLKLTSFSGKPFAPAIASLFIFNTADL